MRAIALIFLAACTSPFDDEKGGALDTGALDGDAVDADGDGFGADEDCNDAESAVNPGAPEVCNGVDDNCDGAVDEGVQDTFYGDADGDGYGASDVLIEACAAPSGAVTNAGDCDDDEPAAYPGGVEACDGIDNDCDGDVDEDGLSAWYTDADGDGFGDPATELLACSPVSGMVVDATDCDDADAAVSPNGEEVCNELDDDCDGDIDEHVTTVFYGDADGDGFGDADVTDSACEEPEGYAADAGDCDDTDAAVSPAGAEVCNGIDDDCDGALDEADASDAATWYLDADSDGYGDPATSAVACDAPSGYLADATDCDDASGAVNPGETEICNGIDDDCDAAIDDADSGLDASTATTWYADSDSDGYGDSGAGTLSCTAPSGAVADATDCDDADSAVNPSETEICNGIDDDCDGDLDDDDAGLDTSTAGTWYTDGDGDGYGDATTGAVSCDALTGAVANGSDCDDADSAVNPGEAEVCNSVDDDCDGDIDDDDTNLDDSTGSEWYPDTDGDGYGDPDSPAAACDAPSGYLADASDCDDSDAAINPDEAEICNGVDDDCDGTADNGLLGSEATCVAESCLEILDDGASSGDGTYWVDFAGTATETLCDMTSDGGGWTLIFSDDFESTPDAGWSLATTYSCGSFSTILGGYGVIAGGELDNTVDCQDVDHSEAWVELDYIALDSWDGETAYVEADGVSLASWSQDNHTSSYGEVCGWDRGYYGSYDSTHAISETLTHSAADIEIIAGSTLDQAATDESFGVDDVWVWVR